MPRIYNIRWTDADNQELTRAVNNFNAKLRRLEKKNPKIKNALPSRTSVGKIKELITSRDDFRREVNALRKFSEKGQEELIKVPGNEYNLKMTRWQKEQMTARIGYINRRRKTRLKEILKTPVKSRGKDLGYTMGDIGMGKADEVSLTPMKAFSSKMGRGDLNYKWENILRESQSSYWNKRDVMLKENYIKALEENFKERDITELREAILDMDDKKFISIFRSEDPKFELAYPGDEVQEEAHLQALYSIFKPNYLKQKGD